MSKKLAINSQAPAFAVSELRPFETYGAMSALSYSNMLYLGAGWLAGTAREQFHTDTAAGIDYAVISYSTPIAWHLAAGGWRVIGHNFSASSSKHQGRARWGVRMHADRTGETVTSLQESYGLSPAQWSLLVESTGTYGAALTGQRKRTASILIERGLARVGHDDKLHATERGEQAWS